MTSTELLYEGITLMFIGMGFTLFFLLLLILVISVLSKAINRFFSEKQTAAAMPASPHSPTTDEIDVLRPVIIAAIAHHRSQQGLD